MSVFMTSDLHFNHDRAFIYEPRGFKSIEEHDAAIIERWNTVVTELDEVYVLGDLLMGNDLDYGRECIESLNGHIRVIPGNHDTMNRLAMYGARPHVTILSRAEIAKIAGYKFFLCHYKAETSCLENMTPLRNHLINLHGHTHSKQKFEDNKPYQYNVALDAHNCFPVNVDQIVSDIRQEVDMCLSYL